MNKNDDNTKLGRLWELEYNLKRIKALALEIADNDSVDVTPTAQAEIIANMADEIKDLL